MNTLKLKNYLLIIDEEKGLVYGVKRHFQQYFSYISRQSVLLVEETGIPGENHQPATSHIQTLSHNVVSSTSGHERGWNSQL